MTKAKNRRARKDARRQSPSAPRVIGANDNLASANDDAVVIRGVMLNKAQAKRLETAEAKLAQADVEVRKIGRDEMLALEAEIERAATKARRQIEDAEVSSLASIRGEAIEVSDRDENRGRIRITSRDGLETLLTARSITLTQHAAGLRYRTDYEAIDPERGLTPPALDQTRSVVRGGDGYAQKRREIEERIRDLEAMIQAGDPTFVSDDEAKQRAIRRGDVTFRGALGRSDVERVGRAVWALREIAGKGSNLLSLSSGGDGRQRNAKALMLGLDCAAIAYGLE